MELKAPLHGRVRNTECKGLVINYGDGGGGAVGYKMGKIRVRNFSRPPPPPFKEWELFAAPPSIRLKLQATM